MYHLFYNALVHVFFSGSFRSIYNEVIFMCSNDLSLLLCMYSTLSDRLFLLYIRNTANDIAQHSPILVLIYISYNTDACN